MGDVTGGAAAGAGAAAAGAAGAGAAAAGAGSGAAGGAGAAGAAGGAPDWLTGFNDESKGFVQNKGWKNPVDVVDSYKGLEKLLGAPQNEIVRLPKEDDAEGWSGVFNRLGRPAEAKGYGLQTPKEGGNPEFTKWAEDTFHAIGLTTKQANGLAAKWAEHMQGVQTANVQSFNTKAETEMNGLKKEWGAAFEQNKSLGQRACREFGIDAPMITKLEEVMGTAGVMKLMHNIGSKVGDAAFVGGNGGGQSGVMTPAQAKDQISSLLQDKTFVSKLTSGDDGAKKTWEKLHQMATPGDFSLG